LTTHPLEAGSPAPEGDLKRSRSARRASRAAGGLGLIGRIFGGEPVEETVETRMHFPAEPAEVWRHILFYEDVPGRPPLLPRALLPHPIRTVGDKSRVGAVVECVYSTGLLAKRMTAVHPPNRTEFEVIEQRLGIEDCVLALDGSVEIRRRPSGCDVALTTRYLARLRPRFLWRRLERILAGQLHRHILNGMRAALPVSAAVHRQAAAERGIFGAPRPGAHPCTPSESRPRR